jgi:hypothetical protein
MSKEHRFSDLSALRQGLVRLCQSTNYGGINDLAVSDREPILSDPQCTVMQDVKLDSEQRPREETNQSDFLLSAEVVRLMALMDEIQNGTISSLEIRAGVPRRVIWKIRPEEVRGIST